MALSKTAKNFIEFIPLLFALFMSPFLVFNELLVFFFMLFIIGISFLIKYNKGEWTLFFLGLVLGSIIEIFGDFVNKLQFWSQDSFFGIPLWLPLFMGISFVFIQRIGRLIVKP